MGFMNSMIDDIRSRVRAEAAPLGIVLVATLLAKGGAFLPGYSIDDYCNLGGVAPELLSDVLSKGRVGHWLLLRVSMALQLEPNAARIFYVAFSIVAYAAFGLAVVRFWRVRGSSWLSVAAAIVIANHPYIAEIFTFRIGLPPAALVMALLALILFSISLGGGWFLFGSGAFILALSLYPIALHFGLMAVIMGLAIEIAREGLGPEDCGEGPARSPSLSLRQIVSGRSARLLAVIVSGTFGYAVLAFILRRAIRIDQSYFGMLQPAEVPGRIQAALSLVGATFLKSNVLVSPLAKVSFVVIVGLALLGLFWSWRRRVSGWRVAFSWVAVGALLGAAVIWSIGLSLVLRSYWPVPRNMAHAGILWGGCIVLAGNVASSARMRLLLGIPVLIVVLSFIGASEQVLDEQLGINARDSHLANRIVAALERQQGFSSVRRVVIVGKPWAPYPASLARTAWGDLNISSFGASWSQVELLREVSGYDLRPSTEKDERSWAESYCSGVATWPGADSVLVRGEVAVVCLAR